MNSVGLSHSPIALTWLAQAYNYVGAHKNTMRYENERDRALQRTAMPLAAVAWVFSYHWIADT